MTVIESDGNMPGNVKVGWRDYTIECWSHRQGSSRARYGETSHLENRISVDLSHGTRQGAATLLHEILHCVYTIWCMEDQDKEERFVSAMADGLATVWRDNPDVMGWIARNIESGAS